MFAILLLTLAFADEPSAKVVPFHGHDKTIELSLGTARAVLSPQSGGRVLLFTVNDKDAMYLEPAEKAWTPGKPFPASAGRFTCAER